MKLLVVCQYYYPENFQITPICEQLADDGYDVTVLTGLPNYPTGIIPEEYKKAHRDEVINGVHVIRCKEIGRKKGATRLALNYLSYMLSASGKVKSLPDDFDLVFVYQLSPVLMAIPGKRYAKKHHIPMLLYCCDLWPESMKMYISRESNILFRLMRGVSRRIYASADLVASQSLSFLPYLIEVHGIPDSRLKYLPAFADEAYLAQDFTPENDVVDFVFMGNLGIAQNLMAVLEAINLIKNTGGFHIHFVGDGTVAEEMKSFVRERGMEDIVSFYGRRPAEEMPAFYKLADACLVSLKPGNATGLTLPAKVQGYMAAGKPILGMIEGSAADVIREAQCGICVKADDIEGFAASMRDFIENKESYKDCGVRAREYFVKHFRKEIFMETLESEFERLGR